MEGNQHYCGNCEVDRTPIDVSIDPEPNQDGRKMERGIGSTCGADTSRVL